MSDEAFGLKESVSMALGGMIGGGIYAVLGVVAQIATYATWFAFVVAGVVSLCAGYSYVTLNGMTDNRGGTVSFIQCYVGSSDLAGMAGWTLLFGYVGSMAMYAFAFAEFTVSFAVVPETLAGVAARPLLSILVVVGFVALNLAGARATGGAEEFLVALKVLILLAFGAVGVLYATRFSPSSQLRFGTDTITGFGPIMAAAISFVAFQGWQLLFYDQESIVDPEDTIGKAVYLSIPAAIVIYALVGLVTVNLAPAALQHHPHVALKDAARTMMSPFGLATVGGGLIALSALFSTGSAINATLFSSAHFAKGMLGEDLLPDDIGSADADGIPERTLLVLGVATAAFAAVGSLGAITSFASLAFILVFGSVSLLCLRERDRAAVNPIPPAVGFVGAAAFLPLMAYNLYTREPNTFYAVLVVAVFVVGVELLYFEREFLESEVVAIEEEAAAIEEEIADHLPEDD